MEFGHLEGVPQPQESGTKTITMVINHILTGMILQVGMVGEESMQDMKNVTGVTSPYKAYRWSYNPIWVVLIVMSKVKQKIAIFPTK